jgi:FKBP-type peptidyl-prolyl cis-trans isomerase FkpA
MSTTTAQRTGIWIIAIVLAIGTLAGFIAMILAPKNEAADTARTQAVYEKYQKDYAEYQKKVDAQSAELSTKYYSTFAKYKNEPASFDASKVKKLETKDLKMGIGAAITKDTRYSAYYIGWNPKGKVFDQSFDGNKLKAPIPGGNLIEGWNKGVIGMKMGGVRELTITSDLAYGATGSGEDIPANTPIKFIVMVIPSPPSIPQPAVPQELQQAYGGQ